MPLRLAIVRLSTAGPRSADVVQSSDEVVLIAERDASDPVVELAVELRRGDRVRDQQSLMLTDRQAACRLLWSHSPGSSRLACIVRMRNRIVFRQTLLVASPNADGQGRLGQIPLPAPSQETLIAYSETLAERLACNREPPRRKT